MTQGATRWRIGDYVDYGKYPCKECGQAHHHRVTETRGDDIHATSWAAEDGHAYQRISDKQIIEALEATNETLQNRIAELESNEA